MLHHGTAIFVGATLPRARESKRVKEKEHDREDVVSWGSEREIHFFY